MNLQPIESGKYYHIYNKGNNGIDIFYENENYLHFLRLYEKYIEPVAETFAWCLLKNHFHLLVYIKDEKEINIKSLKYSTVETPKIINASNQFSHFFNSYTQSMNKRYKRTGSLFEKPFERKLVSSEKYLKNLIYYINNNAVHHRFVDNAIEYPWSSYGSILSEKPTKIKREQVIKIFDDIDNFVNYHNQKQNLFDLNELIIE
jgi:putative transposase